MEQKNHDVNEDRSDPANLTAEEAKLANTLMTENKYDEDNDAHNDLLEKLESVEDGQVGLTVMQASDIAELIREGGFDHKDSEHALLSAKLDSIAQQHDQQNDDALMKGQQG